eukprot:gene592-1011_t
MGDSSNTSAVGEVEAVESRVQDLAVNDLARCLVPIMMARQIWDHPQHGVTMFIPGKVAPVRTFMSSECFTRMSETFRPYRSCAVTIMNAFRLICRKTKEGEAGLLVNDLRSNFWFKEDGCIESPDAPFGLTTHGASWKTILKIEKRFLAPLGPGKMRVLMTTTCAVKDLNFNPDNLSVGARIDGYDSPDENEDCPICLQPVLRNGPPVVSTKHCSHVFHEHCLREHKSRSRDPRCPICREPLTDIDNPQSGIPNACIIFLNVEGKFRILYALNPIFSLQQCVNVLHPNWLDEKQFKKYFKKFLTMVKTTDQKEAAEMASKVFNHNVALFPGSTVGRECDLMATHVELPTASFLQSFDNVLAEMKIARYMVQGELLEAHGLEKAKHLNGKVCKAFVRGKDLRLAVRFEKGQGLTAEQQTEYCLKVTNLRLKEH